MYIYDFTQENYIITPRHCLKKIPVITNKRIISS